MTCLLKRSTPFALLFALTATIVMLVQFYMVSSHGQTPVWHYPVAFIMIIIGYVHLNRSVIMSKVLEKDALPIVIAALTTIVPICSADILQHSAIFLSCSLALENLGASLVSTSQKSKLFIGSLSLGILVMLLFSEFNVIPLLIFALLLPAIGALGFKRTIMAYSGFALPILAYYYITWYCNLENLLTLDKFIYTISPGEIFKANSIYLKDGLDATLLSLIGIVSYLKLRRAIPLTNRRYIGIFIIFYLFIIATVVCSAITYKSLILASVPQVMFITFGLEKIKDSIGTLMYYLLFLLSVTEIILGFFCKF